MCPPFSVHSGLSSHWRNYCFAEYFFIFLLTLYIAEKPSIGRTDFVTKMRITMNSKADNIARRIRLERFAMYYVSGVINPFILSLASFSTLTWKVRSPIQMWWRGILKSGKDYFDKKMCHSFIFSNLFFRADWKKDWIFLYRFFELISPYLKSLHAVKKIDLYHFSLAPIVWRIILFVETLYCFKYALCYILVERGFGTMDFDLGRGYS